MAGSTALAQVLNFAFYPFMTRMYDPADMGIFGVFAVAISILTPLSGFTYQVAISLPKTNNDASRIARLSILLGIAVAAVVSLGLFLGFGDRLESVGLHPIGQYAWLVPVTMVSLAAQLSAQNWLLRHRRFGQIAVSVISQALVLNLVRIGFGFFDPTGFSLAFSFFIATVAGAILLVPVESLSHRPTLDRAELKAYVATAKRYFRFPLLRTPQDLLNAASQGVPVAVLAALYSPAEAGLFSLARSTVGAPLELVGNALGNSIYPRLADDAQQGRPISPRISRTTFLLFAAGIVPLLLTPFLLPVVFPIIFGAQWQHAGNYGVLLTVWLFAILLNVPAIRAIPIIHAEGIQLSISIVLLVVRLLSFVIPARMGMPAVSATAIFVGAGVVANLLIFIIVQRKAKSFDRGQGRPLHG